MYIVLWYILSYTSLLHCYNWEIHAYKHTYNNKICFSSALDSSSPFDDEIHALLLLKNQWRLFRKGLFARIINQSKDILFCLVDDCWWIPGSLSSVGLTGERVWMLSVYDNNSEVRLVSLLSLWIVSIFSGQRNNDWAILSPDPGSDELTSTGSHQWAPFFYCEKPASSCMNGKMKRKHIWKRLQFWNTTKTHREKSLFRDKLGAYSSREKYKTIQMCECSFFFWTLVYWKTSIELKG